MTSYTLGHHESVLRSHRWRTVENSAAYLVPHLSVGASVLDVGCSPGNLTAELAGLVGPTGSVLGVDNAAEVIEAAEREHDHGRHGNLGYEVRDVMDLDFAEGAFDVVHAHQVLQHLSDPVQALREMTRVTRPGGLVPVRDADYAAMTWYPESPALDDWRALCRRTARGNGGEPDAGRRLLHWASGAGFTEVTPSASVWCFANVQDRQWWEGLQADRITQSAIAEQVVSSSTSTEEDLARMAQAWRDWVATETAWFAALHGELVCRVDEGRA